MSIEGSNYTLKAVDDRIVDKLGMQMGWKQSVPHPEGDRPRDLLRRCQCHRSLLGSWDFLLWSFLIDWPFFVSLRAAYLHLEVFWHSSSTVLSMASSGRKNRNITSHSELELFLRRRCEVERKLTTWFLLFLVVGVLLTLLAFCTRVSLTDGDCDGKLNISLPTVASILFAAFSLRSSLTSSSLSLSGITSSNEY